VRRAIALLLLVLSFPLSATTISLVREGAAVAGGEVCRFAAGDPENPFKRWLASQDVLCVPAGGSISFPAGLWNVFARADGAISSAPLTIDGRAAPVALTLTLQPAASITPVLQAGRSAVVYVPRRGSALPAKANEAVTVPANEELWLIVVEKSAPVAIFPIPALEARAQRSIDAHGSGPSAILGWMRVSDADRAALAKVQGLAPPTVRASVGGPAYESDALPPLDVLHGAFVRVRGVPAGEAELRVGGRGWVANRTKASVASPISMAASPLIARPASTVMVHWSAIGDFPALDRSLGGCQPPKDPPAFIVTLSSCPTPRPNEEVDSTTCTPVREETFAPDMTFGAFTAEDVPPGTYRAEMRFGKLPPWSAVTHVAPLEQQDVRLTARYFEVYGSVTMGGEPLNEEVLIKFPGDGYGFAAAGSDYRGVVKLLIGADAQIKVTACDGAPDEVVLTDTFMRRSSRFDIDIPANELKVRITDTFTREALAGASVKFAAMSLRVPRRPVMNRNAISTLDDRGDAVAVFNSVPDREIQLTVSHAGYQKQNVPPFSVSKTDRKIVDIELVPLRGNRGRIHSPVPFDTGAVFWFSPAGDEIERAELSADGTFIYASPHESGETMAVVSLSHPLWVAKSPAVQRHQPLEMRFPNAPSRTFDVSIPGADRRDQRHIGVMVGGLRIPQPALRQHQFLRGQAQTIRGAGPILFRDIAETGPIEALLGPLTTAVASSVSGMDIFAFPPFDASPRKPLEAGANSIVFELQ
jgi:hypothetical protein